MERSPITYILADLISELVPSVAVLRSKASIIRWALAKIRECTDRPISESFGRAI